ncbi:MAG TPA: isoprenylcysteine carboxylmethyltransferase family protein [Ignavibacteria bacterium]
MSTRTREYFPAFLNLLAAVFVMLISFSGYFKFHIEWFNVKLTGIIVVYAGMGICIWSTIYLKGAITDMVLPRFDYLVKNGPYNYCRHPIYLGITIAFIGLALALRSWMGLISVLLVFLPREIHRAKLEEKMLSEKFGDEWLQYKNNTCFLIPGIKRKQQSKN